jgi:phosphoribosyl 1,2-cyclic phosphodiesterase
LTTIDTFASGSSGNAALLSRNGTHVLLDAGISCRRITAALRACGLTPQDLSAIFITHTHSDHIGGLQTILKNWDVLIYASEAAARALTYHLAGIEPRLHPLAFGASEAVGAFTVTAFPTSHDAPGSSGYRFDEIGMLTDTGYVTEEAAQTLLGASLLLLESNHDVDMLRSGPYPYYLKARILGEQGHLSNADAAAFAVRAAEHGTAEIILGHLSQENNTPELAYRTVSEALRRAGFSPRLSVAPRSESGECHQAEEALCSESRSSASAS